MIYCFSIQHKATPEALENFRARVRQHFQELKCRELKTLDDIEFYAQNLVHTLHTCAAETIPMSSFNPFTRPDWTKNVKALHDIERAKRRLWMADGRPRGMHHPSYREYKRAKRHFRNVLDSEHDKYMRETYRDIDEAAECDIRLFWRLTKRKKPRSSRVYPEIRDKGGNLNRDPPSICEAFAAYFEEIYTPLADDNFDSGFNDHIDTEYDSLKIQSTAFEGDMLPGGTITNDDIHNLVNKLKLRKAPGEDAITNEHIKLSGPETIACLANLFNAVVLGGEVPGSWKRGFIVPLHKGPGKPKELCKSYRPVALLSCIFKLFERVIYTRVTENCLENISFPNKQQQGFQTNLGCLTASFVLHETIFHNLEMGNNTYVGFLDTSQAFDTVWRKGLMYKLHNLGIAGKMWTLIDDCHINIESCIVVNQTKSRWFGVNQGVRQGGVLSTFLYLVYIDDLINEIQMHTNNCGILSIPSSCPTLADDMSLIALQPRALQMILDIAYSYANRWRFKFNALKSCVLKFRAIGERIDDNLSWNLGGIDIPCEDSYTHLGIIINKKCSLTDRVVAACTKGRKSYFSLSDIGSPFLNPMTMSYLYKRVVLPTVLYGCELWNGLSTQNLNRLNTFQHFVCKNVMNLPQRYRSDICESLFDVLPIDSEIDARKLLFFGRLCRLKYNTLPKEIFLTRLFSYAENLTRTQYGFIPDIVRILHKYDLSPYLQTWLHDGTFPEKLIWKRTVRNVVSTVQTQLRTDRTITDQTLRQFWHIFDQSTPCSIWKSPKNCWDISVTKFVCKIYAVSDTYQEHQLCPLCDFAVTNLFQHASCSCPCTFDMREEWWHDIANTDIYLCAELSGLPEDELFLTLLGRHTDTTTELHTFRMKNFRLLRNTAAAYNRALNSL